MKKITTLVALVLTFVMGFNIVPVYAADYSSNGADTTWENFVQYIRDYTEHGNYAYTYLFQDISSDESSLEITYTGFDENNLEMTSTASFTYKDGILELSDRGNGLYEEGIYLVMLESFINLHNYDFVKGMTYLSDLKYNNTSVFEDDGIEMRTKRYFTDEQMEELENSCNGDECYGVYNPLIYTTFKLDLKNGLKNYDENKILVYDFLEGANQTFDSSKGNILRFRIDADIYMFDRVYIDEQLVDSSNYTVTEGSTIIEFKKEYSEKLSTGTHTLKVAFLDGGNAVTEFSMISGTTNPKTGNEFGYKELLVVVALGGLAITMLRSKKKRYN